MTTKALFITAMGGPKMPIGPAREFVRSSGDILTATAHGLETGAGPFKILNSNADAPSGLVAALASTGTLTGVSVIDSDVAVVDGKTYTFIATPAADGDVDVTAVDAHTMANLAQAITQRQPAGSTTYDPATVKNPNVEAEVTSMGGSGASAVLTITAKVLDATLGDAIDIASIDSTITASGATLASGVDGTDYFIIKLTDDTFSLATTRVLAEAGTAVTLADAGTGVNVLQGTVDCFAESMEDVLLKFLTHNGMRSYSAEFNIAKFWETMIVGSADLANV